MGTEVHPKEAKVIVRERKSSSEGRVNAKGHILQYIEYSMTPQKSVARTKSHVES